MNKRDYLKEFIETTNLKYQRKYIPNTLTEKEKNKVAKYLIEIKEGKIENTMPITVSDESGGEHEFDMADIDEFDPIFGMFEGMDRHIVGEA